MSEPIYVNSLYTLDELVKSYRAKINCCMKRNFHKEEALQQLEEIVRKWEERGNPSDLLRRYISPAMKRIIVLTSTFNQKFQVERNLEEWLPQKLLNTKNLEVSISLSLQNECTSIPQADCFILLRTSTPGKIQKELIRKIIHSAEGGNPPVILDLVNNLEAINSANIQSIENEFPMSYIDESKTIKDEVQKIDNQIIYTFEECKQEALKYTKRSDFIAKSPAYYKRCKENNWMDEVCSHMRTVIRYTPEYAKKIARHYKTRHDLNVEHPEIYNYLLAHHLWNECAPHLLPQIRYDYESIKELASHYTVLHDFIKEHPHEYSAIHEHGWTDILSNMKRPPHVVRTLEDCRRDALKYQSRVEYMKKDKNSYMIARKKGWLPEICAHMKK